MYICKVDAPIMLCISEGTVIVFLYEMIRITQTKFNFVLDFCNVGSESASLSKSLVLVGISWVHTEY